MGTSSWTYPGWAGIVYPARFKPAELVEQGLALYAQNPLLRTVGIDRYFYDAPGREEVDAMEQQLPADFPCVVKVWNEITSPVLHGKETPCPTFLDPDFFAATMIRPFERMLPRVTFVLEFSPLPERHQIPARDFAERLGEFLTALPAGPRYAVELRERRLLTPRYLRVLQERGVSHTLNYWGRMPTLFELDDIPGILTAPFVLCRLLLPPGGDYEALESAYAPFDRLHRVDEPMRRGVSGSPLAASERVESCWFSSATRSRGVPL
jgi:hypothetical protein